jgi:glycosyltransferase involved in cell wall biosynthesis
MREKRQARTVQSNASSLRLPLVSILVPSYNSKPFLTECLESTLQQTYPRVEIIVVDDGSNDGSLELAHNFRSRGVRVIAQDNRGQSGAVNTAFDAASGDYFQYLDADDVLHPQKIETQVERLQRSEPSALASGAWARFKSSLSEATFQPEAVWQDLAPLDWLVQSWAGGGMMHVAGWLIPRAVAEEAAPWVESLRWAANLDSHFFTRALLASSMCHFCPEARSYYRSGHTSMSSWNSRKSLEATLHVLLDNGDALLRQENSVRTRGAFADSLQRFVYATYPNSRDLVRLAEMRIRELGGSQIIFTGGHLTRAAAKFFGWKCARRLRQIVCFAMVDRTRAKIICSMGD